jgi:hypothetical protein
MKTDLSTLVGLGNSSLLIVCAGFEERASRGAAVLLEVGFRPARILQLTYGGEEHKKSYEKLSTISRKLMNGTSGVDERPALNYQDVDSYLDTIPGGMTIICDITGLARIAMLRLLTKITSSDRTVLLLYTEAADYYPREADVSDLLAGEDRSSSFFKLIDYEAAEVVYSANCQVEEVPGFAGKHLPNYPLMLIAFLTFKRSRLGAVLREYEANSQVFIKSQPIRPELAWREKALEAINFDLIAEHKPDVISVETLDWYKTFECLSSLYRSDNNQYRFNFVIAPLGSKMQTVGTWMFARKHPEVRLVTSTPTSLFPEKYSIGYGATFLVDDLSRAM